MSAYSRGVCLTSKQDITNGSNRCCPGQKDKCCRDGFEACAGWDAASGLGSPVFPIFSKLLVDLP